MSRYVFELVPIVIWVHQSINCCSFDATSETGGDLIAVCGEVLGTGATGDAEFDLSGVCCCWKHIATLLAWWDDTRPFATAVDMSVDCVVLLDWGDFIVETWLGITREASSFWICSNDFVGAIALAQVRAPTVVQPLRAASRWRCARSCCARSSSARWISPKLGVGAHLSAAHSARAPQAGTAGAGAGTINSGSRSWSYNSNNEFEGT